MTMADKLIHNLNANTQNYPSCRLQIEIKHLDTQLIESTKQKSKMSLKFLYKGIRKRHYKTLGSSVINNLTSPPSHQNSCKPMRSYVLKTISIQRLERFFGVNRQTDTK